MRPQEKQEKQGTKREEEEKPKVYEEHTIAFNKTWKTLQVPSGFHNSQSAYSAEYLSGSAENMAESPEPPSI